MYIYTFISAKDHAVALPRPVCHLIDALSCSAVHRAAQRLLDHFNYRFPKVFPPPKPASPVKVRYNQPFFTRYLGHWPCAYFSPFATFYWQAASADGKRPRAASPKGRKRRHGESCRSSNLDSIVIFAAFLYEYLLHWIGICSTRRPLVVLTCLAATTCSRDPSPQRRQGGGGRGQR